MKRFLVCVLAASFVLGLGLIGGCGGSDDPENICEYDSASEICQQAFDCCTQLTDWANENGYEGYDDPEQCVPYTCTATPDATCQGWIAQAVATEATMKQEYPDIDFPDCY